MFSLTFITALSMFSVSISQPDSLRDYTPDWPSIDSRPLPPWYDEAKFGVFMHWGLYSVPSLISEWFWEDWKGKNASEAVEYMANNYKPDFTYPDFGPMFTAELFNATTFAQLVAASGAKYYVLTSKHHEGYTMWPSKYSWNWNSQDVGPSRDLVGELAAAFRKTAPDVKFGLYYSLFEWFNPLYLSDKASKFTKADYRDSVSLPQLHELITEYKPEVLWSDGDAGPDTYWQSQQFLAWLYNDSPVKDTVVTNDRWGTGTACKHGGYYSCQDRYNPGKLQNHKWENAMTVDSASWGFRRTASISDILTIQALLKTFATTISCGGNMLMNVGPTHDGRIIPVFQERLLQMGQWLKVNGEAVYSSKPWIYQNDTVNPDVWYTSKMTSTHLNGATLAPHRLFNPQVAGATVVYAFLLKWPDTGKLTLGAPTKTEKTTITLLGYEGKLLGKPIKRFPLYVGPNLGRDAGQGLEIDLTTIQWWKLPNTWAWVLKLENLANSTRVPQMLEPAVYEKTKKMEMLNDFQH